MVPFFIFKGGDNLPRLKASNNARSVLVSTITDTQTSFEVQDASTFPDSGPFRITIDAEVMEVGDINKVSNLLSNIQRGVEGSSPASHDQGSIVVHRFTAGAYDELVDQEDLQPIHGKFHEDTGHRHTGEEGDAPQIGTEGIEDGAITKEKLAEGLNLGGAFVPAGRLDDLLHIESGTNSNEYKTLLDIEGSGFLLGAQIVHAENPSIRVSVDGGEARTFTIYRGSTTDALSNSNEHSHGHAVMQIPALRFEESIILEYKTPKPWGFGQMTIEAHVLMDEES